MADKAKIWTISQAGEANIRLAWWKEIIPKQQLRINAMLAEANRVAAIQMMAIKGKQHE